MSANSDKVESILFAATEQATPEERAELIRRECGDNEDLQKEVERLLEAYLRSGDFLEGATVELRSDAAQSPLEQPGTQIGPYKLLQQIGEGGMGAVFMAEQDKPVRRKVALKIIKPGMDSRKVVSRFEAERQTLALMDHPHIAKVFDAGTTETGRPYFVMELVKGVPITQYCDERQLNIEQRLNLFSNVCHAVQHAHQKGIIHRDIKPSNVLVAEYDDQPVPKVIDFGVAKAISQQLTERTLFTEFGQVIGTFEYMSPEQAKFNQLDVDTRTDIYSLGVLLYELLVGSTPLDKGRLRSAAFDEVLRIISEEEPPAPSARLSSSGTLPAISAKRRTEPEKLTRSVRGDLDWIAMKCLEKDRSRRYETASSLAHDIKRYLDNEPIEARPPSTFYRLRKLVRRRFRTVIAGTAIVASLIIGTVGASLGLLRAERQRDLATQRLYESLVAQARATRMARTEGYRTQVISLLERARRLETANQNLHDIRQQVVDCMGDFVGLPSVAIDGISANISRIALHPYDRKLAVGTYDGTIQVYDIDSKQRAPNVSGHSSKIIGLDFTPDGLGLVSVDDSGKIKTWNSQGNSEWACTATIETGVPIWTAAIAPTRRLAAGISHGQVHVWGLEAGEAIARFDIPPGSGHQRLTFNDDGEFLAATTRAGVGVWNSANGELQRMTLSELTATYQAAFNFKSSLLACAGEEGLYVLDFPSYQKKTSIRTDTIVRVAFQPRSELVAFASISSRLNIWNAATNREMAVLRYPTPGQIQELTFRRDGKLLAAAKPRSVRIWDLQGPDERVVLRDHTGGVPSSAFSYDGKFLATGSKDLTARVWDANSGELLQTLGPTIGNMQSVGVGFSPNSHLLATGGWAGSIQIWDWKSARIVAELAHDGRIWKVSFSPDGRLFAVVGANGLEVWNVPDYLAVESPREESVTQWEKFLHVPDVRSRYLSFSPDNKLIAWNDGDTLALRVWNLELGEPIPFEGPPPLRGVHNVAFLADSRRIVYIANNGMAQVWDVLARQSAFTLGEPGTFQDWHLSASPNGRWLLAATNGNIPGVWDLHNRRKLFDLPELHSPVWSMDWAPDSDRMVIGLSDGEVSIWRLSGIIAQLEKLGLGWERVKLNPSAE